MWFWVLVILFFVLQNALYFLSFKKFNPAGLVISIIISVLFYFLYQKFPVLMQVSLIFCFLALTWAGIKDFRERFVMDYHLAVIMAGALWVRFNMDYPLWLTGVSIGAGFMVLFAAWLYTKQKGIGLGDVLAFTIVSIMLDPAGVFAVLIITCILGIVYGGAQILVFKNKGAIPMVPFIGLGLFLYLPFRETISNLVMGQFGCF
jgi:prepilin signal peptidase PulO-like enzyme (type II secretory pathway)